MMAHNIPSMEDQNTAIDRCKQHLKNDMMKSNNSKFTHPATLALQYGHAFYMDEKSFSGTRKPAKACFQNSYRLATNNPNLIYVEGQVDIGPLTIEHAWVIDKRNKMVIDPTLTSPTESHNVIYPHGYFGIPFNTDYIMKVALRSKVYGVLSGMTNPQIINGTDTPQEFLYKI